MATATRAGSLRYRASRALESYVVRNADAVTTICEGLRGDIVGRGISPGKVTVIPNAVEDAVVGHDSSKAAELRRKLGGENRKLVGFLGSYYGYEGLDVLVGAAERLVRFRRDFRIILAGGGPEEDRLRRQVQQHGMDDLVQFAGRVAHSDIGSYYAAMDILVYPRLANRLTEMVTPLKPLEAMANEKPVLASDVGGHRELIVNGRTGFLFAPGDPDALCRALAEALDSPKLASVAAAGKRFVESERTWKMSVGRYEAVYQRLLQ